MHFCAGPVSSLSEFTHIMGGEQNPPLINLHIYEGEFSQSSTLPGFSIVRISILPFHGKVLMNLCMQISFYADKTIIFSGSQ